MITVTVSSGETLSGIAAQYGTSYQAIARASGISNPNVIYVGEKVIVPSEGSFSSWTSSPSSSSSSSSSYSSGAAAGTTGGSGYHIPGVSDATAACIAFKESTNGQASPNVFQLTAGSGEGYYPGESLAQQEAAAGRLAASQGVYNAWERYDGC